MLQDKKYNILFCIFIVILVILCVYYKKMSMIDFAGMDIEQTRYILSSNNVEIIEKRENSESIPEGIVIRTNPNKFSTTSRLKSMEVYVSNGKEVTENDEDNKE